MEKEKLLQLFCNYLNIQENLSEICYIIDDLRSAGANDDDLKELGYKRKETVSK